MKNPFALLKNFGVLGMNQRNLDFIMEQNPRKYYPRADNKLVTKKQAEKIGIPVPELYHSFSSVGSLKELPEVLSHYRDFVLKPASGSGGEGIVVIEDVHEGRFRKSNGEWTEKEALCYHAADILSGLYSLGGQPDDLMIEYRVKFDSVFSEITYQGVPDVRIIVYLGTPIMGMLRLPTSLSNGRANLHQGAVGVGVEMESGKTLEGVWKNSPLTIHPDTNATLSGRIIPHWGLLLKYASKCCELSQLGYVGTDFVLDANMGPLLLEINTRPGLNIQLANKDGLLNRVKQTRAF